MSKYALKALISAAADDAEIKQVLANKNGSVFNHIVNSILSLTADEMKDLQNTLSNDDHKSNVIGKAEERNNPGPGGGSFPIK